jgi:hypothetical protein
VVAPAAFVIGRRLTRDLAGRARVRAGAFARAAAVFV